MDMINNFTGFALQPSVPIILGVLCGTTTERGGITLLGVEGIILIGAFVGTAGSYVVGSALAGMALSLVLSGVIGWFYALPCLKWRAHQSVVGVRINLFVNGITAVMLKTTWQAEDMSGSVAPILSLTAPGLSRIPILGTLFKEQSPYFYGIFLIVEAMWIVSYKTKFGPRCRAIGDQLYAVQTTGVQVNRYRYITTIIARSTAGLTGPYLFISRGNLFVVNMTTGRGFMGLATNIFGGWQPLGPMGADMIFAVAQVARFYPTDAAIPPQFVQILPYAVTLIVLLFVGKRVKGPETLGKLVGQSYTRTDTEAYERSTRNL